MKAAADLLLRGVRRFSSASNGGRINWGPIADKLWGDPGHIGGTGYNSVPKCAVERFKEADRILSSRPTVEEFIKIEDIHGGKGLIRTLLSDSQIAKLFPDQCKGKGGV